MKKLEDIPKKNAFEAPEGYFDRLPGIIQARLVPIPSGVKTEPVWALYFRYSLRYVMPALMIAAAAFFYLNKPEVQSAEELLASIDSAYLVDYLEETDVSSDDLLETIYLDNDEANAIQQSSIGELNMDEQDVEDLSNEFEIDYF